MLNDWSTWIIEDRCREALGSEKERIKCRSIQDMAHACGEALGSEQEMLNDRSTWDIATRCEEALRCYVTVGTFARRGLSSTAKTLRSLSGGRGSEY